MAGLGFSERPVPAVVYFEEPERIVLDLQPPGRLRFSEYERRLLPPTGPAPTADLHFSEYERMLLGRRERDE